LVLKVGKHVPCGAGGGQEAVQFVLGEGPGKKECRH